MANVTVEISDCPFISRVLLTFWKLKYAQIYAGLHGKIPFPCIASLRRFMREFRLFSAVLTISLVEVSFTRDT